MSSYHDIINNIPNSGSTQLLALLFGNKVYHLLGSGQSQGPSSTLLTLFGSLMAPIAEWLFVILACYVVLASLINKAQSGEFMRQNWNGFWPWLRMTLGLTAVVPSFTIKNLVAIQTFFLCVALFSSSVADITWQKVLDLSAREGLKATPILNVTVDQKSSNAYLNQIFHYVACSANKLKYSNTDSGINIANFNLIHPDSTPDGAAIAKQCSSDKFIHELSKARTQTQPIAPDLTTAPGSNFLSQEAMMKYTQYQHAQYEYLAAQTALDFIQNKIWPFYIRNMDAFNAPEIPASLSAEWKNILNEFHQTLKTKMQSAINDDHKLAAELFTQQVSKYGWISAANYYRQLAQEQQMINSHIMSNLQRSPDYVDLDKQVDLTTADSMTKFHVKKAQSWLQKVGDSMASGTRKYILDPLGIDFLKMGNETDPVLAMVNFGQKLEGVAEIIAATKLVSLIPVVGDRLSGVINNSIMDFILKVFMVSGIVLGQILPNIPWVIFLFAIMTWLIHVAEMFVAAPFWVVVNAFPEGGTFLSNVAKKGFNNLIFIALFPILAIGGLVLALGISWIGMYLLNAFAYIAFKGLMGWTLPFDIMGIVLIYTFVAWNIMVRSFSLITTMPRAICNWISLSLPGLNQFQDSHDTIQASLMNTVNPSNTLRSGLNDFSGWVKARSLARSTQAKERVLRRKADSDEE